MSGASCEIESSPIGLPLYSSDGKADERYGVCSNYLEGLEQNDEIQIFVRSAPNFHLPKDPTQPIILIGPGELAVELNLVCLVCLKATAAFKRLFEFIPIIEIKFAY